MPQDNKNFPPHQPGKNPGQNPGQRPQQNPGKPGQNPGQNPNWNKPNQGKPQGYAEQKPGGAVWSPKDIETLKTLAQANTPVDTIASKLGKSEDIIQAQARELNLVLEES